MNSFNSFISRRQARTTAASPLPESLAPIGVNGRDPRGVMPLDPP